MNRKASNCRGDRGRCALCRRRAGRSPAVPRLPGPGAALCRSDAQHHPVLGSASGGDENGTEPCLPACRGGADAYGRGGLGRRRRRLAELQQDARLGPLRAARRDQRPDRRQAQGPLHLRHQAVYELRIRSDHGPRSPDRHHPHRHFLDRPSDLRRELAHARGRAGLDPDGHARGGLPRRHVVPRIPGWARAGL